MTLHSLYPHSQETFYVPYFIGGVRFLKEVEVLRCPFCFETYWLPNKKASNHSCGILPPKSSENELEREQLLELVRKKLGWIKQEQEPLRGRTPIASQEMLDDWNWWSQHSIKTQNMIDAMQDLYGLPLTIRNLLSAKPDTLLNWYPLRKTFRLRYAKWWIELDGLSSCLPLVA